MIIVYAVYLIKIIIKIVNEVRKLQQQKINKFEVLTQSI